MTNIELAIQKAVEGGYDNAVAREHLEAWKQHETLTIHDYGWIFLSPDFWVALGKTEGWGYETIDDYDSGRVRGRDWKIHQHRLIDAIQQGRSIDEFFGEILKK